MRYTTQKCIQNMVEDFSDEDNYDMYSESKNGETASMINQIYVRDHAKLADKTKAARNTKGYDENSFERRQTRSQNREKSPFQTSTTNFYSLNKAPTLQ